MGTLLLVVWSLAVACYLCYEFLDAALARPALPPAGSPPTPAPALRRAASRSIQKRSVGS